MIPYSGKVSLSAKFRDFYELISKCENKTPKNEPAGNFENVFVNVIWPLTIASTRKEDSIIVVATWLFTLLMSLTSILTE